MFFLISVTMGVVIPLIGVLFGYTHIFLKVSSVKSQLRQHQLAASKAAVNPVDREGKQRRPKKPGYTQDDVKLAKTLFTAFLVFLICW